MRYINTILIILFSFIIYSSVALANEKNIKYEGKLTNPFFDIYVAEVDEILEKNPTNENPTKVKIKIIENIRGIIKPKHKVIAIWYSIAGPSNRVELSDSDEDILRFKRPEKKEWLNKPIPSPNVGDKIIIFTARARNSKQDIVRFSSYYTYSNQNLGIVLEKMVSRNFEYVTVFIFGFLFIVLILKIVFYFDPQVKKGYIREHFFKVLPYLLPLELLLYGYYHYETSKHYNKESISNLKHN